MAVSEPAHGYDIISFACIVFLTSVLIKQVQNWTILDLSGTFIAISFEREL